MDYSRIDIEKKITAPITWDSQPKFKIEDLHQNLYNDVLTLIKHHYFREEPMCKSIELLRDSTSVKTYLDLITNYMKDTTSLVAISAKSGRVVGALITRINSRSERSNTYSRVNILEGEALDAITHLKGTLVIQANAYEALGHDTYLRVYVLVVHPSYKKKGVGHALLEACCHVALSMEIPAIAGIFTSSFDQLVADNVGFSLLTEIPYNNWLIDDEVVFNDPGIGNYSAAFMIMLTPNEETLKRNKEFRKKEEQLDKRQRKTKIK